MSNKDDFFNLCADICRIGAEPGGSQILEALFPGTASAVTRAEAAPTRCPVCRQPHPADVACKPLEASDNGPTLTRREDL